MRIMSCIFHFFTGHLLCARGWAMSCLNSPSTQWARFNCQTHFKTRRESSNHWGYLSKVRLGFAHQSRDSWAYELRTSHLTDYWSLTLLTSYTADIWDEVILVGAVLCTVECRIASTCIRCRSTALSLWDIQKCLQMLPNIPWGEPPQPRLGLNPCELANAPLSATSRNCLSHLVWLSQSPQEPSAPERRMRLLLRTGVLLKCFP